MDNINLDRDKILAISSASDQPNCFFANIDISKLKNYIKPNQVNIYLSLIKQGDSLILVPNSFHYFGIREKRSVAELVINSTQLDINKTFLSLEFCYLQHDKSSSSDITLTQKKPDGTKSPIGSGYSISSPINNYQNNLPYSPNISFNNETVGRYNLNVTSSKEEGEVELPKEKIQNVIMRSDKSKTNLDIMTFPIKNKPGSFNLQINNDNNLFQAQYSTISVNKSIVNEKDINGNILLDVKQDNKVYTKNGINVGIHKKSFEQSIQKTQETTKIISEKLKTFKQQHLSNNKGIDLIIALFFYYMYKLIQLF